MESVIESKGVNAESEILTGVVSDSSSFELQTKIESGYILSESARNYAKTSAGIVGIVAFAFLPFFTLPGLIIVVLLVEIYLADWTYSSFKARRITTKASNDEFQGVREEKGIEDDRSRLVSTTSSKDQFIK